MSVQLSGTDSTTGFGRVTAYTDATGYYTTTVTATDYFVEFKRDATTQCGGCYNDQYYTQTLSTIPAVVHVTLGSLVTNINSTFNCGTAPFRNKAYIPRVVR